MSVGGKAGLSTGVVTKTGPLCPVVSLAKHTGTPSSLPIWGTLSELVGFPPVDSCGRKMK